MYSAYKTGVTNILKCDTAYCVDRPHIMSDVSTVDGAMHLHRGIYWYLQSYPHNGQCGDHLAYILPIHHTVF